MGGRDALRRIHEEPLRPRLKRRYSIYRLLDRRAGKLGLLKHLIVVLGHIFVGDAQIFKDNGCLAWSRKKGKQKMERRELRVHPLGIVQCLAVKRDKFVLFSFFYIYRFHKIASKKRVSLGISALFAKIIELKKPPKIYFFCNLT